MTVEHNTLNGGSIGQIARSRKIDVTTSNPSTTDRWFHYDQVGSVMHVSNAAGNSAGQTLQDAWGNSLSDAEGLFGDTPGLDRDDWHHNTKEYDGNTGLVYMYQRWYLPETGTFVSQDPVAGLSAQPSTLNRYVFAVNFPIRYIDPKGLTILTPNLDGTYPTFPKLKDLNPVALLGGCAGGTAIITASYGAGITPIPDSIRDDAANAICACLAGSGTALGSTLGAKAGGAIGGSAGSTLGGRAGATGAAIMAMFCDCTQFIKDQGDLIGGFWGNVFFATQ